MCIFEKDYRERKFYTVLVEQLEREIQKYLVILKSTYSTSNSTLKKNLSSRTEKLCTKISIMPICLKVNQRDNLTLF
jgi:DNA-binding transcriptional regulator GbsR (MarR family)